MAADRSYLPEGSRLFQVLFVACKLCLTIDEAASINDCPAEFDFEFDLEPFLMTGTALSDFAARLDKTAEDTEALLARLLSDATLPDEIARPKRLMDSIRYSSLNGGKRLRPFLVVESAAVFGVPRDAALLAGAALECIHCYSLVHDDLPAMDNSDLRRGRPTVHKVYDDATAILAGDGLLTLAFDIITRDEIHRDAGVRLALTRALARGAGIGGMVGGQLLDLAGEGRFGDREPVDVARVQQMKTGALLRFGCIAGALLGQASAKEYQALDDFSRALGEAFQIADDLLDVESDAATLGKPAGADAELGKTTFVTQLGIEGAKQRVRDLIARADAALAIFGARGDVLRAAARFVAERKN
jgi:farnesyl diphosphate synthase